MDLVCWWNSMLFSFQGVPSRSLSEQAATAYTLVSTDSTSFTSRWSPSIENDFEVAFSSSTQRWLGFWCLLTLACQTTFPLILLKIDPSDFLWLARCLFLFAVARLGFENLRQVQKEYLHLRYLVMSTRCLALSNWMCLNAYETEHLLYDMLFRPPVSCTVLNW